MSVDTCGAIGTILGHDTFSAVIGGKGVGSEDGGALLNCGGHHLPLQGLRVGSADCSGRVRGSLVRGRQASWEPWTGGTGQAG